MQLFQSNGSPESEFVRHEPCENCGSSDGKSLYSDGHTFCFVCHHYVHGDGTVATQSMTTNVQLQGSAGRLQKRGISEQTCEKFKCYREGEKLRFYYFSSDGALQGAKVKGKDKTFTCEGKVNSLYGIQLFRHKTTNKQKKIVITEGEMDCLSVWEAQPNWDVVSIPNGAQSAKKAIQNNYEWLNHYDKIVLFFDNDEAGLKATERVLEIKNQVSNQLEIHCLNLPEKYKDISELYEEDEDIFSSVLKDNLEIIEFLINKFIERTSDKKSIFKYFMKITSNLSPLEVDVSLDLLSSKLNTAKDILKKELKFQTSDEKEDVTEQSISSISIFKDLIIAEMISNKFSPNEEIDQLLELNSEFKKLVDDIKNKNSKKEAYLNISYTKEQHLEAVSRLYLHFANLKIDELIQEFEESKDKNFQLLQEVEDIKKKKEIYQNTI